MEESHSLSLARTCGAWPVTRVQSHTLAGTLSSTLVRLPTKGGEESHSHARISLSCSHLSIHTHIQTHIPNLHIQTHAIMHSHSRART
ncbi:hypothetical protein T484DRAFT_1958412 [Baffinella frigidus]|nr:hypothetical protein T484DRAFT_1958412 [Cryptophyta sp. CCMP2293]